MFRLTRVDRFANVLLIPIALVCLLALSSAHAEYSTAAQTVWLDEQKVRYHLMGDAEAPVAILLGGGPGFSSWNLEPVQGRLAVLGYRTAVMDMLGVGENATGGEWPTGGQALLDAWVDQIEALRLAVSDEQPVVLLGHSWGALMALLYTRAHPDAVRRLVLLNPVDPERRAMRDVAEQIDRRRSRELGEAWDDELAWEQPIEEREDPAATARHQIERSLPSYFDDYAQGQRYAEQFDASDFSARLNIEGWRAYRENPVGYDTIRGWSLPIEFLGCRQDLLMPTNLEAMQSRLSFVRVTVLEGCVHFPWEEAPAAFDEALGEHLGRGGQS
ncbi:alpha/beta fold hydrolase [Guyparkeria sp.]|uniref:alpha/beta fold hydrolase n=1 Tax=Guyparkeria sp. TaxID=2035736 RepID=UPI003970F0F8